MKHVASLLLAVAVSMLSGCGRETHQGGHGHHHEPPHGGTAVTLGDEDYHLEFVFTPGEGRLQLYVLSAHMAGFVRLPLESVVLRVRLPDREETLPLLAAENTATGEMIGNTSLFEARADWLKPLTVIPAVLDTIEIRGRVYSGIRVDIRPAEQAAPARP